MSFWKPGTIAPGVDVELDEHDILPYNPYEHLSIESQRKEFPIFKYKSQLLYLIQEYQVTIVVGETGTGKTTQLPQYLFETGWANDGYIACTQPRKISAMSIATRVAQEKNVEIGSTVGYSVLFDECSSSKTKIKYMTDSVLFYEMLHDPLLSNYSVIMIDEAHERGLYTDVLLGLLKKILKKRNELRIIISSATLDAKTFFDFFNTNATQDPKNDSAVILSITGRMFPVDVHYLSEPTGNYVKESVETVLKIHKTEEQGDILVFLTGKEEIDECVALLNEHVQLLKGTRINKLEIRPLYGGMSSSAQLLAFESTAPNTRKVVVATNVAEASITIPGIVYVIDCGFSKIRVYRENINIESLVAATISKASAMQRAGRAGRTRPGKVYRLYPQEDYNLLSEYNIPEMQRSNLGAIIIELKAIGIENVLYFDFLSPPPAANMIRALELLYSLNSLDDAGKLTDFGLKIAEIPLNPMMSAFVLNSEKFGCVEEALIIASMISVQNIYILSGKRKEAEDKRRKFCVEEGDHISYINVFRAFLQNNQSSKWCATQYLDYNNLIQAVSIRTQLARCLKKLGVGKFTSCSGTVDGLDKIRKCLVSGYFSNAAKVTPNGTYKTVRDNQILEIHRNSVLSKRSPKWIIYHEVIQTTQSFMHEVTVIEPEWLTEIAPHYYKFTHTLNKVMQS